MLHKKNLEGEKGARAAQGATSNKQCPFVSGEVERDKETQAD